MWTLYLTFLQSCKFEIAVPSCSSQQNPFTKQLLQTKHWKNLSNNRFRINLQYSEKWFQITIFRVTFIKIINVVNVYGLYTSVVCDLSNSFTGTRWTLWIRQWFHWFICWRETHYRLGCLWTKHDRSTFIAAGSEGSCTEISWPINWMTWIDIIIIIIIIIMVMSIFVKYHKVVTSGALAAVGCVR